MGKRDRSQNGKRARTKGLAFEREVGRLFRTMGFPNAGRHLEFQKDEAQGFDLKGTDEYRVQCKAYKDYAPISKLYEVEEEPGTIPVLITKGDYKPPVAVMPLWAFEQMVRLIKTGCKYPVLPAEAQDPDAE